MRAFHVVSVDFKLRLGVDDGVFRKQQVLVALLRICLLGVLADDDLAVEDSGRGAVEHALIKLAAGAVRLGVVDGRVTVHVLAAADHVKAVKRAFGAFPVQDRFDLLPRQRPAKRHRTG